MSTINIPRNSPVSPPMLNRMRKLSAKSMGAVNRIDAPHSVAVQLKTLMPLGIATTNVRIEKMTAARTLCPETNM